MNSRRVVWVAAGLMVLFFSALLPASDIKKEKRWAEQIEESLLDGDVIYLKNKGSGKPDIEFFSLYTKADEPKKMAVLLMHGIGAHPDWPQLINPLRAQLPEAGWTVLSIQLPILANDAKPEDYKPLITEASPRIDAGIEYLHNQGFKKVAIVAHSLGSVMASYYLADSGKKVAGYIAIGMPESNTPYLEKIKLPVLDLYGSHDLPTVLKSADARAKASAGNKAYQQKKIKDANHFFDDQEEVLFEVVVSWLEGL